MINEISGAIIAITLAMTAVFVPVTFMTGPVGTFYRDSASRMATSIILSGVVDLTLTPVLCAMIRRRTTSGRTITSKKSSAVRSSKWVTISLFAADDRPKS